MERHRTLALAQPHGGFLVPTLLTRDEAHAEFARSACRLALDVGASRMAIGRLLSRRGSLANLSICDRHAVADHWALVDELRELGFSDIIEAELEGILSVVADPDASMSVLAEFAWSWRDDEAVGSAGSGVAA